MADADNNVTPFEGRLLDAFTALENVCGDYNTRHPEISRERFYARYRQHLVNCMSFLEQTGLDAVLSSGIDAMDAHVAKKGF